MSNQANGCYAEHTMSCSPNDEGKHLPILTKLLHCYPHLDIQFVDYDE